MNKLLSAASARSGLRRAERVQQAAASRPPPHSRRRRSPQRDSLRAPSAAAPDAASAGNDRGIGADRAGGNSQRDRRRAGVAGAARERRAADAAPRPRRRTLRPRPSASRKARTTGRSCPRSPRPWRRARSKSSKCSGTAAATASRSILRSSRGATRASRRTSSSCACRRCGTTATRMHARVFYTAEALGKLDALHSLIFREIHVNGNPLNTVEKIDGVLQEARRQPGGVPEGVRIVRGGIEAAARGFPQPPLPHPVGAGDGRQRQVHDRRVDGRRRAPAVQRSSTSSPRTSTAADDARRRGVRAAC